jgi:hypothetical protein
MNKIIRLLLISLLMVACSSNEKTARNKIESFIEENANDAKSYEFISMNRPDTLRISDTLKLKMYLDSIITLDLAYQNLKLSQQFLSESEKEMKGEYSDIYKDSYEQHKKEVEEYSKEVENAKKGIELDRVKLKEIEKNPAKNVIVQVRYKLNCRLKNKIGALTKTTVSIIFKPQEKSWGEVIMEQ